MAEETKPAAAAPSQEIRAAQATRPGTDANVFIQLLVGLVGTVAVTFAVFPFKGGKFDYIFALINRRGPIQYIELFMAFMVLAQIVLKTRIVRQQLKVMVESPVDLGIDLADDQKIQEMRRSLVASRPFSYSIVLSRLDRLLALWLATKDVGRVSGWASTESDRDTSSSDSSYALSRVLIWAIPILGFIGTVQGLGVAVAAFADFLAGSAELSAIKGAISNVTIGLGVAFDTTFLALMLVTFLMFPLSSLQRREENLFVEVDIYLDDMIISRLPSPESQPIVIENLEDSIEAAFRRYIPDPDRYDEVFTRSIEKAAGSVEEKFGTLAKNYETSLRDLTGRLQNSMSSVGESIGQVVRKATEDIRQQDETVLAARRQFAEEEREKLKADLREIHESAQRVAVKYQEGVQAMQAAAQETARLALDAAKDVGEKIEKVGQLAANIESLLRVEQAVEKGLAGLSASEEFRKALEDLRKHLATTDQFCERMSKPRVITLREEVSG
jgi:methyl-accepting chemotaxis protein